VFQLKRGVRSGGREEMVKVGQLVASDTIEEMMRREAML